MRFLGHDNFPIIHHWVFVFSQQGDVYQKDIESFFKLRRSTVSSQLDTLEKKGLIQRVPVSHDARLKKAGSYRGGTADQRSGTSGVGTDE